MQSSKLRITPRGVEKKINQSQTRKSITYVLYLIRITCELYKIISYLIKSETKFEQYFILYDYVI